MSTVDPACRDLADRLADLEEQVQWLEDLVTDPELTPQQRASIRSQITRTRQTIASVRAQLAECRASLSIRGIELTQGIQYFSFNGQGSGVAADNSVPLIAQRTLALRVYIDSKRAQGPITLPVSITGRVTVERQRSDGSWRFVTVLTPTNGSIAPRPAASIDRGNPNHTLNFRLSAPDCQGRLRLTVLVREQGPVVTEGLVGTTARASAAEAEASEAIESFDVAQASAGSGFASVSEQIYASFHPVPTLRLLAVLIHYTGQGLDLPAPNGFDFAATLELLLKTYPMGRLEFANCIEHEFDGDLSLPGQGCGRGFDQLRDLLVDLAANSDQKVLPIALLPRGVRNPNVYGCGWPRQAASVFDGDLNNMAQEVGHAFTTVMHAPACGAPNQDTAYPKYDDYPSGSIGEFGFDVFTSEVKDPETWTDFMGYCRLRWVSPYTYNNVRNGMSNFFGQQFRSALEEDRVREVLFLNFRLHRDGRVEVRPSFHLPKAPNRLELGAPSEICCELLDRDGEVLVFHRCRSQPGEDPDGPYRDFNEALLWAGEAVSIRFLEGREVLHVHEIEDVAPEVEFRPYQLKREEPMELEWTGRHPEKDLRYSIRYSNDGGKTWTAVAAKLREPRCRINPLWLPGGDACLLQVVASSGIRTSLAAGDLFRMPLKRRRAYILSPRPRTKVEEGAQVVFRGGGISSDFGLGAMEDAVWSSDLDGMLGRGFELAAEIRSAGLHTITLTVPDGVDGVAAARTSLRATARE